MKFVVDAGKNSNYHESGHEFGAQFIQKYGARLGDEMILYPLSGQKKVIKLNRTKYFFSSLEERNNKVGGRVFALPKIGPGELDLTLDLIYSKEVYSAEETGRYLLKSLNSQPFCINGIYSNEAYIERGDKIELQHNILTFQGSDYDLNNEKNDNLKQLPLSVVKSRLPILIEGETGTGKTRLAKEIHDKSQASGGFVHLNLASFSTHLLESELFGHVKGSFTGALKDKEGAFVKAKGGTLFLDEVDSLPLEIQTKLLIFLDTNEISPVGSHEKIKCHSRIVFASGQNTESLVERGLFRKDFFFRLTSGLRIHLDSLRDNLPKIREAIEEFSHLNRLKADEQLIDFYTSLPWPGNYRQLISHLNKKMIMNKGRRLSFDQADEELLRLSSNLEFIESAFEQTQTLEEVKIAYAKNVFYRLKKNYKLSAQRLDITPATLKRLVLTT